MGIVSIEAGSVEGSNTLKLGMPIIAWIAATIHAIGVDNKWSAFACNEVANDV